MRYGQILWRQEQAARWLSWGIRFFLAAALTASETPGGHAPFALGFLSAAGPGAAGMAALLGTVAGAAAFLRFEDGLAFLAAGILIYTAAAALRGSRLAEKEWVRPLLGTGMFLVVRIIYLVQSLSPLRQAAPCLAAAILVGVSAWFYAPLLQDRLEPNSVLFLAVSLLLALTDFSVLGVSAGRSLLECVVLFAAYQRGPAAGAAVGLCAGLGADLAAESSGLLCTAGCGFAGLLAGWQNQGRIRAAGTFFSAAALALLLVRREQAALMLWETAAGSAVFLLLPARLFGGKRVRRQETARAGGTLERLQKQLERTAAAFRDLYDSAGRSGPPQEENPAVVFDRAAEKVCRGCALCDLCWQKEYTGTFNAFNDATPFLLERGRALAKDFPPHFTNRCIHLPELLGAMNGELSAYLLRKQYRRRMEETRRSARGQYAQLSELLSATAAGLGAACPVSGGMASYRLGAALRPRKGERVCGDTVTSFETEQGLLCLLLADGMGSGEAAQKESALVCRLMRQFLQAGIAPEAALKTLNTAMALRGEETGSFTTLDLLTCRPDTGEAALYKFGGAPSYLKKSGTVRRITGSSLPTGLRGTSAAPDVTHLTLEPGSFAVLVSDGVADPNQDEWLQNLLAGWSGEDPQLLAADLLAESIRRRGLPDDCGVQILFLPDSARES